jgi:FKBP-type peptidyl-prolyl cis-trans isomerase FklB
MKTKPILILLLLIGTIVIPLVSCDDSDEIDTVWKEANEAIFAEISHNPDYSKIYSQSKMGYILYKELESGYGEMPIFTDSVKVLYKGWYKKDWTKADTYTDSKGNKIINKIIFDSSPRKGELPARLKVSDLIDGFATALQNMQEGDKWEVWIPWKLGYGETTYGSIPAYTTLVFEIKLLEVIKD